MICQQSGVLLWKYNIGEEDTRDDAKVVCLKGRGVLFLEMEISMMVYGTAARDQVQEHSISRMEICFKDHGGMMSCTARFVPF